MIFTLRYFTVRREDFDEFVRLSEDGIWMRQAAMGNRALGLWVVILGGVERIMLMTRYDSLEHWQETRGWGGRAGGRPSGRNALVQQSEVYALGSLSRRQPEGDATEPDPGVYSLLTHEVAPGSVDLARELIEDSQWPWLETAAGQRAVGLWRSLAGPENRVYEMRRFESVGQWERSVAGISSAAGRPAPKEFEAHEGAARRLRGIVAASTAHLLRPISRRRP